MEKRIHWPRVAVIYSRSHDCRCRHLHTSPTPFLVVAIVDIFFDNLNSLPRLVTIQLFSTFQTIATRHESSLWVMGTFSIHTNTHLHTHTHPHTNGQAHTNSQSLLHTHIILEHPRTHRHTQPTNRPLLHQDAILKNRTTTPVGNQRAQR